MTNRILLMIVLLGPLFGSLSAYGHEVRPSYLELIQESDFVYRVLWKVPAKGNDLRLSLQVKFDDGVESISEPNEGFQGGAYIKRWKIQHDKALINTTIEIKGLQSTFTEVLVRIEQLNGSVQVARLMPGDPFVQVTASPSRFDVAYTYTGLGIKHILKGFDHLLFLVCLLLIARTPKRILITVTGFTLVHSVTLALSALNIVTLQVAPVEAIIALSIVFLATEIAKGERASLTWKYPIAVSGSFGLLHGFGFAAVLNEIGLPETEIVTGLLFFNIGVEVGQILFVMGMILLIKAVKPLLINKQILSFRVLEKTAAYGVGALASYWLIDRSLLFML